MVSERWRALQDVVDGALERPPAERGAFVQAACGEDGELAEAADRLLRACERADRPGGLLSRSALDLAAPLLRESAADAAMHDAERSAAALEAVGAALSGRYTVQREIARGGMAIVYLARDRRHDRDVAIKVLEISVQADHAARFAREIRTTARLTHPHILTIHDSGEADGFLFYVMPYVAGETLRSRLQHDERPSVREAVRLIRDIADGVAYAHAQGVVHRDLKPENVLLSGGHAVVADFGIAHALAAVSAADAGFHDAQLMQVRRGVAPATTVALGTPAYMAPEQITGTADHRADIYALGVVAYEMLTGVHPSGARTAVEHLFSPDAEPPVPLHQIRCDVPAWLDALVMQMLARDPDARPADAAAVLRAIDEATPQSAATPSRQSRGRTAAAAALILLAALGSYAGIRDREAAGVSSTSAPLVVAVLPFSGSEGSSEYFNAGISDQLAHTLGRLPGLSVAGQTSSRALRQLAGQPRDLGRELGADVVVTGTARRADGRLFVSAAVLRTADGVLLWEKSYDAQAADLFIVQDEIAGGVAAALLPEGIARTRTGVAADRGTQDAEAYDLFQKGRYLFLERGADNVTRSIEFFRQAISRDPTFARAHAALAIAYAVLPSYVTGAADSTMSLVTGSALRAAALDSTLADAQVALGIVHENAVQFEAAVERYRRAIELEPSNVMPYHALGMLLRTMGRTDEAIFELQRAARLDPLAKSVATARAGAFMAARQFEEAAGESKRALAMDSTFALGLLVLGSTQAFGGQPDSAVATLEHGLALHPQQSGMRSVLLYAYAAAGRWPDAVRMHAALTASGSAPDAAIAELVMGNAEPVLDLLSSRQGQAQWLNATLGFGCYPLLDPLWSEARFQNLMSDINVAPCPSTQPWPFKVPARLRRQVTSR